MEFNVGRWLRRISQTVFLALVIYLLVITTYPLRDFPYDLIPQFSPLLALTTALAAREFVHEMALAAGIVILTLVLGRAFCGWMCPLGTLIDWSDAVISRVRELFKMRWREPAKPRFRHYRLLLLLALVIAAAFGLNLAGWFDPLSLVPRTFAETLIPYGALAGQVLTRPFASIPAIADFRNSLAASKLTIIPGHIPVIAVFVVILALGLIRRRFYCRYICPTGALLALIGWVSPFGRRVTPGTCKECTRCRDVCRMGAILGDGTATRMAECNLCLDCLALKKCASTSFGFGKRAPAARATSWAPAMTRRGFLAASGGGFAAGAAGLVLQKQWSTDPHLIRPPGGQDDDEFLARCIRCGECIRVCLTQGLVPSYLEASPTGLWTPRFDMRKGYCEYRCVQCTLVCPTDALKPLEEARKIRVVLGAAVIDRRLCLPWSHDEDCSVCEEMCPVAPKAVELHSRRGRLVPHVVPNRCIGCGICEYACPLEGVAAIRVVNLSASPYGGGGGNGGTGLRYRGGRAR